MTAHADPAAPRKPRSGSPGAHTPETPRALPTRLRDSLTGLGFVAPFTLLFAAFLLWPMLAALWSSFTDRSLARSDSSFVGLANWQQLAGDPAVWQSLWVTVLFTLLSTPPLVVIALVMALLTNRVSGLGWFLRFSFFAPFLLPVAVVTLIWQWMYQPGFGLINAALARVGLSEVAWLTNENTVLLSVVITTVWWTVGFNFLLYLAALQGIPRQVHEAAALDGAGAWRRLFGITLPLLRRTTALVVMLQMVASLKLFDQAYLLTDGTGGPNYAARPIIGYIVDSGFTEMNIGYASAVSYLFFAVIIVAAIIQYRLFSRPGVES
ncbi:carbohydrate ABC transporter permease [Halostreptopolyspora alba]|uniref:Sugar ABC transporter permease n=1 Tax=Halostreptopolyspora alba TaxID=2487137 RepID=A0A3N0EE26_9ACTN|nr:sugar ABC transporter permease [Nocardiopsaceae bacterium YIM 96095]